MNKKINLNDIIARKKQGEMDKFAVTYFDSEILGGQIEIRKIPLRKFMELQEISEEDYMEGLGLTLFECLPMFKDMPEDIMKIYNVSTPSDLSIAVFEDNLGEMVDVMTEINKLYGIKEEETLADKVEEEVKN